jgi:pimeloyl-ACP methyl ester carboxylesterase
LRPSVARAPPRLFNGITLCGTTMDAHPMTAVIDSPQGPIEFADVGSGPPILYFHGSLSASAFVLVAERALLEDGYRLIIPHRPGYYGTPLARRRSYADCADVGARVLKHLGIGRAMVIGTSAGGPPAMSFAMQYPQRTVGLVLQCAQVHRWDDAGWGPNRYRWTYPWLCTAPTRRCICAGYNLLLRIGIASARSCLKEMAGARFTDVQDDPAALALAESAVDSMLQMRRHFSGYCNDMTNMICEDVLSRGEVLCPTLLLYDPADPNVPPRHAEFAARAITRAEALPLRAAGHLIWVGRDATAMRQRRSLFLGEQLKNCA